MVPRRLRFSLELVENSLSLDAVSRSRTRLDNVDHRSFPLEEHLVSLDETSRLLAILLLIGQLF